MYLKSLPIGSCASGFQESSGRGWISLMRAGDQQRWQRVQRPATSRRFLPMHDCDRPHSGFKTPLSPKYLTILAFIPTTQSDRLFSEPIPQAHGGRHFTCSPAAACLNSPHGPLCEHCPNPRFPYLTKPNRSPNLKRRFT